MSETPEPFDGADDDFDFELESNEYLPAFDREILFGVAFCNHIVQRMEESFGEEAVVDLLYAIDRNMAWATEIIANRDEVENILFERHGAFDHDIWNKVQETKAWGKMIRQVVKISKRYLGEAVDEVVLGELQDTQSP